MELLVFCSKNCGYERSYDHYSSKKTYIDITLEVEHIQITL